MHAFFISAMGSRTPPPPGQLSVPDLFILIMFDGVQIMKFLIIISPSSCYVVSLKYKYFPENHDFKPLQSRFFA
jgi:hypothetical protein